MAGKYVSNLCGHTIDTTGDGLYDCPVCLVPQRLHSTVHEGGEDWSVETYAFSPAVGARFPGLKKTKVVEYKRRKKRFKRKADEWEVYATSEVPKTAEELVAEMQARLGTTGRRDIDEVQTDLV